VVRVHDYLLPGSVILQGNGFELYANSLQNILVKAGEKFIDKTGEERKKRERN
jgi:hypothetical protein